MKWDKGFWEKTWSRPHEKYDRFHEAVWNAIIPHLKCKVCDLGCGTCVQYKGKDIDLTGVDYSQNALVEAKKNYPQGKYILADIQDTGLVSGGYDVVVLFGILDYFLDLEVPLKEARRLCKKGGKIIATLYNGYRQHDWGKYPTITGNWKIYEETI